MTVSRRHKDAGLSLIELVVAMAVFALIAIMGLQSLTGMLRNRERLTEISESTQDVSQSVALLRNDLSALVPMLFFPPDRQAPQSALRLSSGNTRLSLSIGGQPSITPEGALGAIHRSEWRFDAAQGTLSRVIWPTLIPAQQSARAAEVVMLQDIDGLTARSYWTGAGWVDGLTQPNGSQNVLSDADQSGADAIVYASTLPLAVEITLLTRDFGDIPIVQSLR